MRVLLVAAAILAAAVIATPAAAHPRHHHHYRHHHHVVRHHARHRHDDEDDRVGLNLGPLFGFHAGADGFGVHLGPLALTSHGIVLGGRPSGCPFEFCGCSASLFIFGRHIPELDAARNWLRFPRTEPAPGMAAVAPSRHHVLVLERHVRGPYWVVHDGNSGHHLTREHVRSIAGFTVVNPRGHRYG